MKLNFHIQPSITKDDLIQSRLLSLAALFLFLYSIALTLAPAVRLHTWNTSLRWEHWIGLVVWLAAVCILHVISCRWLPERDPYIIPIAALLSGWGTLTIWRISGTYGLRQTIWFAVAILVVVVSLRISNLFDLLKRYKYLWLTAGLLLTVLTFVFGVYPGGVGPRLWLGCCGLYLQPSEPLKLLLIAYLAAYLADQVLLQPSFFRLILPTLVMTGVVALILVAQRDLGTACLFLLLYAVILFISSGLKRVAAISVLLMVIATVAAYFSFDVVRLRVDAWLNPWVDPSGRSYQIVQSLLSIGAGGIFGRGPGLGSPGLVPVAESDFVFASITEEAGLLGGAALILLIAILLVRGLRGALHASDLYKRYLAAGLITYLAAQSLLIIGGNIRLFPLTGVTLPFVSYGGSSLLTSWISILLLLQISNQPDQDPVTLPNPTPFFYVGGVLLAGLGVAAILTGWWSVVRGPDLETRVDNPRRAISDRYVARGSLLDQHDFALDVTTGTPGDLVRKYNVPALSPVLGYTHPAYGQAGLEASLDNYLRGLQGNPASLIWWDHLVYGQPPQGLNVRLTLDNSLQTKADQILGTKTGALVLLNASTGEILAISSHPYYDPNQLNADWQTLVKDPHSPLLDRAVQSAYPPGTVVGPFLYADVLGRLDQNALSGGQESLLRSLNPCSLTSAAQPAIWGETTYSGCTSGTESIGRNLGLPEIGLLYERLGWFTSPDVALPAAKPSTSAALQDIQQVSIGQGPLIVSPLQMALSAAALGQNGARPAPRLVTSVHTPYQGWAVIPASGSPVPVFSNEITTAIQGLLSTPGEPTWQITGVAQSGQKQNITWFVGGTNASWKGTPIALALVIEAGDVDFARQAGAELLNAAIHY